MPFDEILPAVQKGSVEAGILIHEGQVTYQDHGLINLLDFGKWWKKEKGLPLPLGVDVVRRDLGPEKIQALENILKESIEYGLSHREAALQYALQYGRGLSKPLADRFVGMYVNHYTVDYGKTGRKAVHKLLEEAVQRRLIPKLPEVLFSDEAVLAKERPAAGRKP
jgi:1,4-dihydroxy-6-naphthoate synthase